MLELNHKIHETSINIKDPLEQNKYAKDEIYYYFNAKYSRPDYVEVATGENASLFTDYLDEMGIVDTIEKYFRLVNDVRTGQLITNIKHLRGSTMRILRSYDRPQFRILKSYSLFVLADSILELLKEQSTFRQS